MFRDLAQRLHGVVSAEYPARPVGVVRIGLGTAAIIRGINAIGELTPLTDSNLLSVPWLDWFPEPTNALVTVLLASWLISAITFTFGAFTRTSGAVLFAAMATSIALDQQAYSNHLLLLTILTGLFVLSEPGAALSVDAKRRGHELASVPGWPLFLMKVQVSVVYLFASITKLNSAFLSGSVLRATFGSGVLRPPESLLVPSVLSPLAAAAVATELLIAFTLWRPRLRRLGVVLGIGLHSMIALLMATTVQLTVFGIVMLSSYVLFFSDSSTSASLRNDELDSVRPWLREPEKFVSSESGFVRGSRRLPISPTRQ